MPSRQLRSTGLTALALAILFPISWAGSTSAALSKMEWTACGAKSPCRIQNENHAFAIELHPETFYIGKAPHIRLDQLQIKDLSSANSEPENYYLGEINLLPADEHFELFKIQIRPTGETDLALLAYSSAKEGPMYYYFLYDRKKKKMIMSDLALPKLRYDLKTGVYLSDLQERPFILKQGKFEEEEINPANMIPTSPLQR